MSSTKLEDVVHSFAFAHFRNKKVLHNSKAGLNSRVQESEFHSSRTFIYYICFVPIFFKKTKYLKGDSLIQFQKRKVKQPEL